MSDHLPDAGKMVCPKCHAPVQPNCMNAFVIQFKCGSMVDAGDGTWHDETTQCITRQRDQLRTANAALVERVKRIESAADKLAARHPLVPTTYPQAQAHVAEYHRAKGQP